jgi:hypothetical protein
MDPKLEQAVQAIKSGNKSAGLVLLAQVLRSDPGNEIAWIWMATAQDDPEKKKQSLERVLRINPANEPVRRALSKLFPPAPAAASVSPAVETAPTPSYEEQPAISEQPAVMEPPAIPQEPQTEVRPAQPEQAAAAPSAEPEPASSAPEAAAPETPPVSAEPGPTQAAAPDLSWLKEASAAPEEPKEQAADLSWLKEDLQAEEPEAAAEPAQAGPGEVEWLKEEQLPAEGLPEKEGPAPDLTWLNEEEPSAEEESGFTWPTEAEANQDLSGLSWLKEEAPPAESPGTGTPPASTGETDDLAWLHAAGAGPAAEPAAVQKPETEEPDFSWLAAEPASEEKPAAQAPAEPAFPWADTTAPTEEAAVKNEEEAIPDWLRQGTEPGPEKAAAVPAQAETPSSVPPTFESEPLSPEDFEAIAAKPAELPFTWDEVTGEPVMKPASEAIPEMFAPQLEAEAARAQALSPAAASGTSPEPSAPVSRPRPAAVPAAPAKAAEPAGPSQTKGMTRGQIVLLILLGLATLIVLLAFGFYLAVNFGWLKAFGF